MNGDFEMLSRLRSEVSSVVGSIRHCIPDHPETVTERKIIIGENLLGTLVESWVC